MSSFTIYDAAHKLNERFSEKVASGKYDNDRLRKLLMRCCNKLGEEATETVVAVMDGKREDIIAESADLVYRLLNLLAMCGISLTLVEAELRNRPKKDKDSKQEASSNDSAGSL